MHNLFSKSFFLFVVVNRLPRYLSTLCFSPALPSSSYIWYRVYGSECAILPRLPHSLHWIVIIKILALIMCKHKRDLILSENYGTAEAFRYFASLDPFLAWTPNECSDRWRRIAIADKNRISNHYGSILEWFIYECVRRVICMLFILVNISHVCVLMVNTISSN